MPSEDATIIARWILSSTFVFQVFSDTRIRDNSAAKNPRNPLKITDFRVPSASNRPEATTQV